MLNLQGWASFAISQAEVKPGNWECRLHGEPAGEVSSLR